MLEDDSDDRYLTQDVLGNLAMDVEIDFYSNSHDVFSSLQKTKPNLILVDYNSTPENGIQVLKELKANDAYRSIPVIILTDSDHPKYCKECYAEGASSVVIKPRSLQETTAKIKTFFTYWADVAES